MPRVIGPASTVASVSVPAEDLDAAIARLVTPTAAELFEARELVLDELQDGSTRHEQDLVC